MRSTTVIVNPGQTLVVMLTVRVGSIDEPAEHYGISHLLEHMMFQSKKSTASSKLLKELRDHGTIYNAQTSFDQTMYFIMGQAEVWKQTLDLFRAIVEEPDFTEAELQREVDVVLEELSMRQQGGGGKKKKSGGTGFWDIVDQIFWKNTEYGHSIGGSSETLRSITKKDLIAYHDQHYKNTCLWVNSPISIEKEVNAYVKANFPNDLSAHAPVHCQAPRVYDILKIKSNDNSIGVFISSPREDEEQQQQSLLSTHSTSVWLMFRSFPYDARRILCVDFITHMLTGLNGIMMNEMRTEKGYTYSVLAGNIAFVDHGIYQLSFESTHMDVVSIIRTFFEPLKKLQHEGGVSKRTFDGLKRSFMLTEATEMRDPLVLTKRLSDLELYTGLRIESGIDGYMQHVDTMLQHRELNAVMAEFVQFNGASIIVKTFDHGKSNDSLITRIAKTFEQFVAK